VADESGTTTASVTTLAADPFFANITDANDPRKGALEAFKLKGWDAKSPAEAAYEAMKSYHEAEKHIGIPKDQILRMPKDATDKEGWTALRARLGVPADPKDYDFTQVKFADGSDLDDEFTNAMRASLHANGVPKDAAAGIVKDVVKFMDGVTTSSTAEQQAAIASGRDALAKSWGANAEANKFIASQAAIKLGLSEDFINSLEQGVGYEKTMQTMLKLGQMMGEDKFVSNQNANSPGVLTREQASGRLDELKRDNAWVAKVNAGDYKANEEFNALTRIIAMS